MKPTNDNGAHSFTEGATFETAENINEFLKEDKTMQAIYLQSMTDFVIRKYKDELVHSGENWRDFLEKYARITKSYADFLKQPLKLEMFIPCDENGNVLSEPKEDDFLYHDKTLNHVDFSAELEQYEKAKENGYCLEHEKVKCAKCGKQATYFCDYAYSIAVCGMPLCTECKK